MQETETRALRRAATVLLAISVVRLAWDHREGRTDTDEETVLPQLLEASKEAAAVEARRAEPLAEHELLDPNTASETELDRLPGVGPSTARAIVEARTNGAVFRSPEDLLQVRGIGPSTLERIRGALSFSEAPPLGRRSVPLAAPITGVAEGDAIDLNSADLEALQTLPGVGPAIAERILVTRREQAFTSVDDLVRVRGIGPATVERLRARATVGRGR